MVMTNNDEIRESLLIYFKARMIVSPALIKLLDAASVILDREILRDKDDPTNYTVIPAEIFCGLLCTYTTSQRIFELLNIIDDNSVSEFDRLIKEDQLANHEDMKKSAEVLTDELMKKMMNKLK